MELETGSQAFGFTVTSAEQLPEIEGMAYVMKHEKSGAKLLYLANDDSNKAFAIGFRTPPIDSTGVFHILEHSVLCGSERFPVKEPFVNLIKSSMQTFLNAMTYPDKTLYPVASTNEQDLLNLMDVYMDAVLHPMIYRKRAIFEQEGWHYELEAPEGPLRYNGVVYNEMKGVLSEPENILYNALCEKLFPDTAYAFESGGDPNAIPSLTYEDFLDAHRRHYRLDNSYLFLYGNMEVERELAFLDERYLSIEQPAAGAPNPLVMQEPVKSLDTVREMVTVPEKACMGLAYVAGTASERMRSIAVDILMDVLMGSNEAPLKRALLEAGIAGEAQGYLAESMLQPTVIIQLKGITDQAPAKFLPLVEDTVARLCEEGLDAARIEASLSRAEFTLREYDFGIADGVILAMNSMAGWLYDDSMATDFLRYEDIFTAMRERIGSGYFEDLLREVVLDNGHMAQVRIKPIGQPVESEEEARLRAAFEGMDGTQVAQVEENVKALRELQEMPDGDDALATLPLLTLDDLAQAPEDTLCTLVEDAPIPTLYHEIGTHHINYLYAYFDARRLAFEDLPYASLLGSLLGKLDTHEHTAAEIDTLAQTHLGSMRFYLETYDSARSQQDFALKFVVSTSSLSENLDHAISLPREILTSTRFDDKDKVRDILTQRRIAMEQSFSSSGHATAALRCASYYQPTALVNDTLSGVDAYRFLKGLLDDFEERFDGLVRRLEAVAAKLFVQEGTLISFTGDAADRDRFWATGGDLGLAPGQAGSSLVIPALKVRNEAFIVPTDVSYAALGYDRRLDGIGYTGSWNVAARALSYDYLWNEVRVKGGAYGVGFKASYAGAMQFYSYRDPHLDETLARFESSVGWLSDFTPTEAEMRGYIISSVAGHDAPMKPRERALRQDIDFIARHPAGYRKAIREDLLATTPATLRSLSADLSTAVGFGARCAFGGKAILEKSDSGFDIIDLLS